MKIIVDTLGGDNSPLAQICGAVEALQEEKNFSIVLVGFENDIKKELQKLNYDKSRVEICSCEEAISNNEQPSIAIKKENSSLMKAIALLKNDQESIAMVSSGNTGALLAAGIFKIGRLKNVSRPSLIAFIPKYTGGFFALSDSGANVDCKPNFLLQFAVLGSSYMKKYYNIENPQTALLSVGAENEKGNELIKNTNKLMAESPINFIGNIEAREAYFSNADVVACDGFNGNILLKATEGTGLMISKTLKEKVFVGVGGKLGGLLIKNKLGILKDLFDYTRVGGAPLLGLNKLIIKSHGSANSKTIKIAVLQARKLHELKLMEEIENNIDKINEFYEKNK